MLFYLGVYNKSVEYAIWISVSAGSGSSGSSSVFSGVPITRKRQGVRRYHIGWCTGTLGGLFVRVSEICLFLVRSKTSSLGTALWKCQIFRIFWIGGHWINGILADSVQSLLLTEQAGIEVTLKECIEEVPSEIFWIKDDEIFIENLATMTEILHGLSLSLCPDKCWDRTLTIGYSHSLQSCVTFASNLLQSSYRYLECHQEETESQTIGKFILSGCKLKD